MLNFQLYCSNDVGLATTFRVFLDRPSYWFKILQVPGNKYIKLVYNLMLQDLELLPDKVNWASWLRQLLMSLGFYEVWLNQEVGIICAFLSLAKQRLTDNFIQGWQERLNFSSRANINISSFHFQPYLDNINVLKYSQVFSKLKDCPPIGWK